MMLPEGGTADVSVLDAYAEAFKRFTNLDEVKERANRLFATNAKNARVKFGALLRRTIGVKFDSLATEDRERALIEKAISDSVDRIKTINIEHFEKFKQAIESGILDGRPVASLRDLVMSATADTAYPKWMVERVVVDQYLTAHAAIQQVRQESAGITHYFWRTASDARVRPSHAAKDGKRFAWADPPQDTGHPGTEIRCRCIADPDLASTGLPFMQTH